MNAYGKISSKGQVVVPKDIRDRLGLAEGSDVEFVEAPDSVTLKRVVARDARFPPITAEEFLARRFKYDGPPITDEMIEQTLLNEARRRFNAVRG